MTSKERFDSTTNHKQSDQMLGEESSERIEIMGIDTIAARGRKNGFVANTVQNIQANAPVENMVAMINAVKEFN